MVAPDQRGYNQSEKPESVEAYSIHHLADDVRHYGHDKATVPPAPMALAPTLTELRLTYCPHQVIGPHDWGATQTRRCCFIVVGQ